VAWMIAPYHVKAHSGKGMGVMQCMELVISTKRNGGSPAINAGERGVEGGWGKAGRGKLARRLKIKVSGGDNRFS